MANLWEVDARARQRLDALVTPRQATSAAVVTELFALWQMTLPRIGFVAKNSLPLSSITIGAWN